MYIMDGPFTNSLKPLHMENVLDPRLESLRYGQEKLKWGVFKGAQMQNWTQQQCNSYSTSSIAWQFNTQSETTLIDRRIFAECQFRIDFTGTAPIGQYLLNDEADAPGAFPLGRVTQTVTASINGTSVSSQYADVLEALLRFNNPFEQRNQDLSMTPSMLDKHARYEDGVGGVRNPLSVYDNGSYEVGRGAFHIDELSQTVGAGPGVPVQSHVIFTVVEPIMMSPFLYSSHKLESGLIGVKNLAFQFSLRGAPQLARIWSHAVTAGVTITNAVVSMGAGTTAPPLLHLNYLTPPLLDSIGETPVAPVWQWYRTDTNINELNQTFAPNDQKTVTNNALQLGNIPTSIYIWFTRPNGSKYYTTPDTAFGLRNLSINYLNLSGQFSGATAYDLYLVACKNGLEMSWTEWFGLTQSYSQASVINGAGATGLVGLTGGFMKLDAEDLAIPDNMAAGLAVNGQFILQASIYNVNQVETLTAQCNIVFVYDGLMTVVDGSTKTQTNVITQSSILEVRRSKDWVDFSKAQRMYGGNFFSKLASLAKHVPGAIHMASSLLKNVGMGATGGAPVGGELYEDVDEEGGAIVGGKRRNCPKGTHKVCKKTKGGASASLAELRQRLMD